MKNIVISNINWILTGVIVLALVGLVVLGIFYMSEESDQDKLADTRDEKQEELNILVAEANAVDEDALLADALKKLEEIQDRFPADLDSTDVLSLLLDYQEETNVDIQPLVVQPATELEIAGQTYMGVGFTATVSGSLENILTFIDILENGEISTFTVSGINLSGSGGDWSTSLTGSVTSVKTSA